MAEHDRTSGWISADHWLGECGRCLGSRAPAARSTGWAASSQPVAAGCAAGRPGRTLTRQGLRIPNRGGVECHHDPGPDTGRPAQPASRAPMRRPPPGPRPPGLPSQSRRNISGPARREGSCGAAAAASLRPPRAGMSAAAPDRGEALNDSDAARLQRAGSGRARPATERQRRGEGAVAGAEPPHGRLALLINKIDSL